MAFGELLRFRGGLKPREVVPKSKISWILLGPQLSSCLAAPALLPWARQSLQPAAELRCCSSPRPGSKGSGNPPVKNFLVFYSAEHKRSQREDCGTGNRRSTWSSPSSPGLGAAAGDGAGGCPGAGPLLVPFPICRVTARLRSCGGTQCRSWWKESDLNNAAESSAARLFFIILLFFIFFSFQ